MRLFPCTLKGDTFYYYLRYENSFPTGTWEELKVTFMRRYQTVKTNELVYQKMFIICMGEEDVEVYYKWLTKLNSALAPPQAQDSFLKEVFRFGLRERLRIFIVSMLRHTLEEVVGSAKLVKYDMMSGKSKTRRKHRNSTSSSSSSTSSFTSSLEEDIKPHKDRIKRRPGTGKKPR